MHTDHSYDCATPVEVLLATARERGLGTIAVTDHNEISGAIAAREHAREADVGVKVIVGEEVKTADQGEVIGLFIEELIPRGHDARRRRSRRSAARAESVYVPHPFDRHALGPRLRASAVDRGGRRRDRGASTRAWRSARSTTRPRALPPSTGSSAGSRLGLARRPGSRLGTQPDARLRRPGRVPAVPARRRDPYAPHQPALRASA